MKDARAREITYLRLSVTDLCDLRCRYCMPAEGVRKRPHSGICTVEELVEIARQAAALGIRKVRLTGGEPLVRRGILDICRGIAALDGIEELCLTTNGTALSRMAAPLKGAGVDRLNVSLDTLRPDRFARMTRTGKLGDVLSGLEEAKAAGFKGTKLNTVLMKDFNKDEIPDFISLARQEPLEVRFIELMPIGESTQRGFMPASAVLEACPELEPDGFSGTARRYRIPGGAGRVGLIEPMSRCFCSTCNRIRVTADGKLKPCLHSDQEIPLRGLSGEALREAIRTGITAKPPRHYMAEYGRSGAARKMNQIGG